MAARAVAWMPAVALMTLIALVSHDPQPPAPTWSPDWLLHAVVFGALAMAVSLGIAGGFHGIGVGRRPWIGLLASSLYGILDEVHQGFVPGRTPSVLDWAADGVGALIVALALQATARAREPRGAGRA